MKVNFKVCLMWTFVVSSVVSQIVPTVPCPDIFEYIFLKDHFEGKITIAKPSGAQINIEVELSQKHPIDNESVGYIALNQTEVDILKGKPIVYQIKFPTASEVPQLIQIKVNNKVICSGFEFYSYDNEKFKLQHKLQLNSPHLIKEKPSRPAKIEKISSTENPQENPFNLLGLSQPDNQEAPQGVLSFLQFVPGFGSSDFVPKIRNLIRTSIENRHHQSTQVATNSRKDYCGYQNVEFTPFVYGGTALHKGEMPWIAAIYQKDEAHLNFLCSGSLLSSHTVITAAHCLAHHYKFNADRFVVFLGRHNLDDYSEKGYETRQVRNYIIHPEYKVRNLSDADIALLILDVPVNFNDLILPICLWNPAFTTGKSSANRVGFIAGWGADENGQALSSIPKLVEAKIYSSEECSSFRGYKLVATSRTLCAGNVNGTGPCIGDSGAGLVIKDDKRWFIRAIVSGGLKAEQPCGRQNFVVYCDVAKHVHWIERNLVE